MSFSKPTLTGEKFPVAKKFDLEEHLRGMNVSVEAQRRIVEERG